MACLRVDRLDAEALVAQAIAEFGKPVKVGGDVVPGSVSWDNASGSLRFMLTGGDDRLEVVYPGRAPRDFKPGVATVVEGTYLASGIFEATSVTPRISPLCRTCHSS